MLPFDEEQQISTGARSIEETLLSGQFWGELRVFLAVAKTKSFNRAAEITNTSQPTVSRQVKRLQDAVGRSFSSRPRAVSSSRRRAKRLRKRCRGSTTRFFRSQAT